MSVLTNTEAIPMCLMAVVRYLTQVAGPAGEEPQVIDRLMTHVSLRGDDRTPESGPKLRIQETCREFEAVGLLVTEEGRLRLQRPIEAQRQGREAEARAIALAATSVLLDPTHGDEAFALALAWYLGLDPLTAPGSAKELALAETSPLDTAERQLSDMARDLNVRNDTRFGQLRHWAVFLGFAWAHSLQGTVRIVPDPTTHLRWRLAEVFAGQSRLPLPEFAERLSALCPVFEGGSYRLLAPKLAAETPGRLSRSTSMALKRLEHEGTISLQSRTADAARLLLNFGGEVKPYTHIALAKEVVQ